MCQARCRDEPQVLCGKNNDLWKDVKTIEAEKKEFENKAEHSFQELQVQNDVLHKMILELQKRDELVEKLQERVQPHRSGSRGDGSGSPEGSGYRTYGEGTVQGRMLINLYVVYVTHIWLCHFAVNFAVNFDMATKIAPVSWWWHHSRRRGGGCSGWLSRVCGGITVTQGDAGIALTF